MSGDPALGTIGVPGHPRLLPASVHPILFTGGSRLLMVTIFSLRYLVRSQKERVRVLLLKEVKKTSF